MNPKKELLRSLRVTTNRKARSTCIKLVVAWRKETSTQSQVDR